jgi:hypothetical protein
MAAAFSMGIFMMNPHVCVDFAPSRGVLEKILKSMRIVVMGK